MIKRSFDIISSIAGVLCLSPLMLIIGVAIKFSSKGPVFFKQVRVGKNEKTFLIFKFRTMAVDHKSGTIVTQANDPRITPLGKILRLTKLDEIPQLINVFLGEMSIVGPRPEIPELVNLYTEEQKKLLTVKPGITSPATIYHRDEEEISGSAEEVIDYHRKILIPKKASFDLAYLEKGSFIYDLKIILLTLISIVTNQSGYMREKTLKQRRLIIFMVHLGLSALAYSLSFYLRFDGNLPITEFQRLLRTVSLAVIIEIIYLSIFGLTQGYWRYVDARDVINLGKATFCSTITMFIVEFLFLDPSFPSGTLIIDGIISFIFFTSLRFSTRFLREAYYPITPKTREKVLILGASDRGETLLRDILRDPDLGYEVSGFIDLDPNKHGIKIHGYSVLGTIEGLEGILRTEQITLIINTYNGLSRENTITLSKLTSLYNTKIKTIPTISDVLAGHTNIKKLQDLKYEDLLGRDEIKLDRKLLFELYRKKTILVTGAGGSIGSELVRQILVFEPKRLLLLDKDETLLYEIQTEVNESIHNIEIISLIGDIRNESKMEHYFKLYKPNIVLHAAAYKHVPLLEVHPQEAVSNNIFGTKTLLGISTTHNVEKFVMISTDKAVNPTNVMGATKALAEKMMFNCFDNDQMKCIAVRFGNVLGSRGSVIPIFRRQIEKGGPIRITDPNITRYFMSIPEATQLVLQAGAMSKGGELFILKMGNPVKIKDLAFRMIEHAGLIPDIDIKVEFTGLRNGEKLYEELLTDLENTQMTQNEKIFVLKYQKEKQITLDKLNTILENIYLKSNAEIRQYLKTFVPNYTPVNPVD